MQKKKKKKDESERNIEESTKKTTCKIYGIATRAKLKLKNLLQDESCADTCECQSTNDITPFLSRIFKIQLDTLTRIEVRLVAKKASMSRARISLIIRSKKTR